MVVLGGGHGGHAPQAADTPRAAPAESALDQLERARRALAGFDALQADAILSPLLTSSQFWSLSPQQRHLALTLDAQAALQLKDPHRALELLERASVMPENRPDDWVNRVRAALIAADGAAVVRALDAGAQHADDFLAKLEQEELLDYAMRDLEQYGTESERLNLYQLAQRTTFQIEPDGASRWWRDLALLELARGQRSAAAATRARISSPQVLISIAADRRFDVLSGMTPAAPAVMAAVGRGIEAARAATQADPRNLKAAADLIERLVIAVRLQEALSTADATLARVNAQGPQAFDGYDRYYPTLLAARSAALQALGRFEEARDQLEVASFLPEAGMPNVDEVVALGDLYTDLGRPADALRVLAVMDAREASPYGHMQVMAVRLEAARQLNDASLRATCLKYLREHARDDPDTLQWSLVTLGESAEALTLLRARLADERQRSDALVSVQHYASTATTPVLAEQLRRREAFLERADVRAAVGRVGRISRYALLADF